MINGNGNVITATRTGLSVQVAGNGDSVTMSGGTFSLADHVSVTLSNAADIVNGGVGDTLMLTGVNHVGGGTINLSQGTISFGANAGGSTIAGNNDTISMAIGAAATVTLSGSTDDLSSSTNGATINVTGGSDTVSLNSGTVSLGAGGIQQPPRPLSIVLSPQPSPLFPRASSASFSPTDGG